MDKSIKLLTVLESSDKVIPRSLEFLIQHIEKYFDNLTGNQLLIGVMYTLMLECGYTLNINENMHDMHHINCDGDDSINDSSESSISIEFDPKLISTFNYDHVITQTKSLSPDFIKPSKIYKLPFNLMGLPEYLFRLLVIPCGDLAVVNLIVIRNHCIVDWYSEALLPHSFIQESNNDQNIASKFQDLRKFSILFKNNIALKGRSFVLNKLQITNNSLEGLPDEILIRIMKFLPVKDILNLSTTCSSMHSAIFQCNLWIFLLKRDFSMKINNLGIGQLIHVYRSEKLKRDVHLKKRDDMQPLIDDFEDADIDC